MIKKEMLRKILRQYTSNLSEIRRRIKFLEQQQAENEIEIKWYKIQNEKELNMVKKETLQKIIKQHTTNLNEIKARIEILEQEQAEIETEIEILEKQQRVIEEIVDRLEEKVFEL